MSVSDTFPDALAYAYGLGYYNGRKGIEGNPFDSAAWPNDHYAFKLGYQRGVSESQAFEVAA